MVTTVEKIYVTGSGENRAYSYEEFTSRFQSDFGSSEYNNVLDFAKEAGFVIIDDVAYTHCVKYRKQRTDGVDIHPVELSFQGRNRLGHLITKCIYGNLVVEGNPGLLDGVYDSGDEIVADISTPEKEALFEILDNDDIIGYQYTTYGNYFYPVFKGEVTTLILSGGFRVDYQA